MPQDPTMRICLFLFLNIWGLILGVGSGDRVWGLVLGVDSGVGAAQSPVLIDGGRLSCNRNHALNLGVRFWNVDSEGFVWGSVLGLESEVESGGSSRGGLWGPIRRADSGG